MAIENQAVWLSACGWSAQEGSAALLIPAALNSWPCCATHPVLQPSSVTQGQVFAPVSQRVGDSSSSAVPSPSATAPTGHGPTSAVPQPSTEASHRNTDTKPAVAKELQICAIWSACLIFLPLLHPLLSFPSLASCFSSLFSALPSLIPSLNTHRITIQRTGNCISFEYGFSPSCCFIYHLSSSFHCFFSSMFLTFFFSKEKKCTMISVLTITQPFHCGNLVSQVWGPHAWQVLLFRDTLSEEWSWDSNGFWLQCPAPGALCPVLPHSSQSQFQTLFAGTGLCLRAVAELCSSKLDTNTTLHPQGSAPASPALLSSSSSTPCSSGAAVTALNPHSISGCHNVVMVLSGNQMFCTSPLSLPQVDFLCYYCNFCILMHLPTAHSPLVYWALNLACYLWQIYDSIHYSRNSFRQKLKSVQRKWIIQNNYTIKKAVMEHWFSTEVKWKIQAGTMVVCWFFLVFYFCLFVLVLFSTNTQCFCKMKGGKGLKTSRYLKRKIITGTFCSLGFLSNPGENSCPSLLCSSKLLNLTG